MSKDVILNPIFKALTRQATFLGVPLVPFFFIVSIYILVVIILGELLLLLGLIPIYFILKMVTKFDDQIFQLFFLKSYFISMTLKGQKKSENRMPFNTLFKSKKLFNSFTLSPFKSKPSNGKYQKTDLQDNTTLGYSAHLPYSSHIDKNIILSTEGELIATWELEGIPYQTVDDQDLERSNVYLNRLLKSISGHNPNLAFYQHRIRADQKLQFDSKFNGDFAQMLNDAYLNKISNEPFKQQRIYFTIVYRPYPSFATNQTISKKERQHNLPFQIEEFKEIISQTSSSLSQFKAKLLGMYEKDNIVYSENLSFLNYLLTGTEQPIRVGEYPFYEILGDKRFHFLGNNLEIKGQDHSTFARCIEIKEYANETHQGILDCLINIDVRYQITHSYVSLSRQEALKAIKLQQNRLNSSKDDAVTQNEQLEIAKDDVSSGNCTFGSHHFSIMVYADDLMKLKESCSKITTALSNEGFVTTFADIDLPSQYFAQLPANFKYRSRTALISSINFCNFIDMHSFLSGKKGDKTSGNTWGQAVTVFPTESFQPYYFNFHEETSENDFDRMNLGHTAILGYAGSGKTFLTNFLINQLQKFNDPSTFNPHAKPKKFTAVYFDKDYGAKGNILALGGQYFTLKKGEPSGFNPLMLDNTPENVEFVVGLLKSIVTQNTPKFTERHRQELYFAVSATMSLPKEKRVHGISRVMEALPTATDSDEAIEYSLIERLRDWSYTAGGSLGWIFDNEYDLMELDESINNFGFDGTSFLDNPEICGAITSYILHRVSMLLDGRRLCIVFDEFWKWLGDEVFAKFIFDKQKTMRKLNGFTLNVTQSPSDCLKSPIASAIIEQSATQIFLANPKAVKNEYVSSDSGERSFNLTEKEFNLLMGFQPSEHLALIKKNSSEGALSGSVVAKINLSGLGKIGKVLSTSIGDSILIDDLRAEYKEKWLEKYLEI